MKRTLAIWVLVFTYFTVAKASHIKVSFSAGSEKYAQAAREYQAVWDSEGEKTIEAMERVSGVMFTEKEVQVVVYEGVSWSGSGNSPMKLRASYPPDVKKATLIHELGHRLLTGIPKTDEIDEHRVLFLVLYDIWEKLYGKDFADRMVDVEKKRRGVYDYESAWKWALVMSKEERAAKFKALRMQLATSQTVPSEFEITLKNNNQREQQTKQQLLRLLSVYDVSNWSFTRKVIVDSGFDVIPHSHPILTLNTRHLKDDELLLATFVHEQLHWYLEAKPKETEEAYKELRLIFPKVPIGFPEGGDSEEWTYKHILVCYLEYQAITGLLGELKARQVVEFWATDHYTWIYKTVLEREREIGSLMRKHKLFPVRRV
ncbi:MAG TPA: hypothetical protein VGQ39_24580 [Pyrinomonadaceae bacterium]|jgi:hypothetical protein|nr:hypothetical protein [Pyrinomonadaceae bacterium]